MDTNISIRMAIEADAKEILNIYVPYVTDTAITFEYNVPSVAEFSRRIRDVLQMYPYIVAIQDDCIVGYAYAAAFRKHSAYGWAVESSVYLKQDCRGKGIGKKLYLALENMLRHQNIININACIAYAPHKDPRLDNASIAFHEHLGYRKAGHFKKCGYKFAAWYDVIWMEKMLGEHPVNPKQVIPVSKLFAL